MIFNNSYFGLVARIMNGSLILLFYSFYTIITSPIAVRAGSSISLTLCSGLLSLLSLIHNR